MVNSVGLLGMTLSDANKAIKKLPYGPIRVVYCSKLVCKPENIIAFFSLSGEECTIIKEIYGEKLIFQLE